MNPASVVSRKFLGLSDTQSALVVLLLRLPFTP